MAGAGLGKSVMLTKGLGDTSFLPTNMSKAMRLTRKSFSAAISWAITRSYRACASRVSVMVAVPTSKLRLADASCSLTAIFCAFTKVRLSWLASTSK